ncbi:MAG: hypothetical protein PHI26_00355 [Atopobiaceae bacterium]|nr:hypothetical protein [Atopobiaceae bacterium]
MITSDVGHTDQRQERLPSFSRREALRLMLGAGLVALTGLPSTARADTQSDLDAAQSQLDAAQSQLDDISNQYQQLAVEQSNTKDAIDQKQSDIDQIQADIDVKQKDLDSKQEILSKRISSSYKNGGSNVLDVLLSSASLDELISNVYYMGKITDSDKAMIEEVKQAKAELDDKKSSLEQEKASLEDLNAQQTQQLQDMQSKQSEVQTVLDGLSTQVKDLMSQRDAELVAAAAAEAAQQAQSPAQAAAGSGGSVYVDTSTSGQSTSGLTNAQANVVNACKSVGSPGSGLCAMWVSQVFAAAGYGYYGGNACDMYANWCTSSNKSNLKVGMIVAVSTHSHTSAGRTYGHIGIYIGNDTMMDNVGYVRTINVNDWISYYNTTVTPRWGWIGGVSLV